MTDDVDVVTFSIEGPDGATDDIDLPAGLVEMFAEEDDDSRAEVVADIALMSFVGRAHQVVHHSEGEPGEELEAIEEAALDIFEDRFDMTYGEATGHSH